MSHDKNSRNLTKLYSKHIESRKNDSYCAAWWSIVYSHYSHRRHTFWRVIFLCIRANW